MSGSTVEILENAFDFVLQAVDDLENDGEHPRGNGSKYAILHLWSGIELLVKYRLSLEHWSLVFEKVEQAQHDKLITGDFRSVTFTDAHARLKNIGQVEAIDRHIKHLKSLQNYRNKYEHFHNNVYNYFAVHANLMAAWGFIVEFVGETIELPETGKAKELYLEIKDKMLANGAFVSSRLKSIRGELQENLSRDIPFAVVECPECLQDAIILNGDNVTCLFCKAEFSAIDLMERVCTDDGSHECPECSNESVVVLESYGGKFNPHKAACFTCFAAWHPENVSHCDRCNAPYTQSNDPEDQINVCQSCLDYALAD